MMNNMHSEETLQSAILAWDPDFTKVTAEEARQIEIAEKSGFVNDSDIDWDNLSKYANL